VAIYSHYIKTIDNTETIKCFYVFEYTSEKVKTLTVETRLKRNKLQKY